MTTIANIPQRSPLPEVLPLDKMSAMIKSVEKSVPKLYPYMILYTGLYNLSFGVRKLTSEIKLKTTSTHILQDKVKKTAARIFKQSDSFPKFQGIFSIAAGSCSILDAFHRLKLIDICNVSKLIGTTGSFCFFYANVTDLAENIRKYEQIEKSFKNNQNIDEKSLHLKKQSTICGILSNFGYIFATAFALFEVPFAITLVVGIVASFCGGLKVLYDLNLMCPKSYSQLFSPLLGTCSRGIVQPQA